MIRIWPWTKFAQLEATIERYRDHENYHLYRIQLYENIALKAMRELAAANKGIRRLKERIKKLEQA